MHAEVDAALRLPDRRRGRRLVWVDVVVVRTTLCGKLNLARPCPACVRFLREVLPTRGYACRRVHYTSADGDVATERLSRMQ